MILKEELRIGNWVEHDGKKRRVEAIGNYGINLYRDLDGEIYAEIPFEELEGIDLSAEILMDFGFEEIPGHVHDSGAGIELQRNNYRKTIVHEGVTYQLEMLSTGGWKFQGNKLDEDPWHVHELQNLCFKLMHQELDFPKYE